MEELLATDVGDGVETWLGDGGGAVIGGGLSKGGGVLPSLLASISLTLSQSSFHSLDWKFYNELKLPIFKYIQPL